MEDLTPRPPQFPSIFNQADNQDFNQFEPDGINDPCQSIAELIQMLENEQQLQVHQTTVFEDIKAVLSVDRVENTKLATKMKDLKQYINILLSRFETTSETLVETICGFAFPINSVEELNRMEEELGNNMEF